VPVGRIENEEQLAAFVRQMLSPLPTAAAFASLRESLGGLAIRGGIETVTFTASGGEALTIAHGLGVVPTTIAVTPRGFNFFGGFGSEDATNFDALVTAGAAVTPYTGDVEFAWIAIG
jgi:hypothetical protein